ncbi:hypothetical protein ACT3TS_19150, partial [Specibacter sp. AOP5-B1-6]|uniref:hypothetical protein n=1 Tax=Specibacter sp. AOP5-B1-6 TaxID=3457653 RepID=UPI00402BB7A5
MGKSTLLTSIWAPEFTEDGNQRPPIRFHIGLNTILGTNRGKNSIGKSTVLYLVDWALGGSQFAKTKTINKKAVGHHTVYFTYEFDGTEYFFSRNTETPEFIEEYTGNTYQGLDARHPKDEFTDWLKQKYGLGEREKSFRALQTRFSRVQESASAATTRPLAAVPQEPALRGIEALQDLFGLYKGLVEATEVANRAEDDVKALTRTQNKQLLRAATIRNVSGANKARTQLANTESELRTLRNRTDNLLSIEDQERSSETAQLKAQLQELRIRGGQFQAQANITQQSLRGTPPIEQDDLDALMLYFPSANVARLHEVEGFHRELTEALRDEYQRQFDEFTRAGAKINQQITYTEDRIRALGKPIDIPDETWNEYGE